jgi:hypothetical protein
MHISGLDMTYIWNIFKTSNFYSCLQPCLFFNYNRSIKTTDVSAAKDENMYTAQKNQNWHLKIHFQFTQTCD